MARKKETKPVLVEKSEEESTKDTVGKVNNKAEVDVVCKDSFSEQVHKAVKALVAFESKKVSERKSTDAKKRPISQLFEDEDLDEHGNPKIPIFLIVGLEKIPEKVSHKPAKMELKNPWKSAHDDSLAVCLITKDPQRQFKDLINPLGIKSLTKIVGLSKLKTKFKPYEAKRNLCAQFDVFLADERILPLLPKLLGKTFFEKKKYNSL